MSSKFTQKKKLGGLEAVKKRAKKPGTVDTGIIDAGTHEGSDATVAQIGFWNEFGTETIPERSFMRSVVKEKKKEVIALQKRLLKKIQGGKLKMNEALGLLGEFMSDAIRQKIISLNSPPNNPATIARKGSSNPLVDTGQLKNSITYEVNR